jgi:hypothetical protein
MKSLVALALLAIVAVGCSSKEPEVKAPEKQGTASLPPGGVVGGGSGSGDITPMTPSPIPNAPVSGGTSLGDGGGSVGIAAKAKAKEVAGNAGQGSLGNPSNPDSQDDDDSGDN